MNIFIDVEGGGASHDAPTVFSVPGGWTWFNDPRAIAVGNGYALGAITGAGALVAYDLLGASDNLRGSTFDVDDHANPSFALRPDGKILAAASEHNGSGFYTYLSNNSYDPSSFGAETNRDAELTGDGYSYASQVYLGSNLYLFFRSVDTGTRHFYYSVSADDGATFSAKVRLLSNDGNNVNWPPYVKMVPNGSSRIDFFCTDGSPNASTTNSIYHFYFDGSVFRTTAGSSLTLPITPSTHLTKVYNGATNRAWIWDCAIDGSNNPVCVYAALNSTTNHRYRRAVWNGSSWDDTEICAAGGYLYTGETYYSGGVAIDPDDINTVFASREVNDEHQIWRYTYSGSWSGEQITKGGRAFRPYVVRNAVAEPRLFYMKGDYQSYEIFDTTIELMDSTAAAVTLSTDSLFANVSFVTNFHGPAGDTSATDFSANNHTMTFRGNAVLSAVDTLFGVSYVDFDGNGDLITVPNSATFQWGTGDFAIEVLADIPDTTPAAEEQVISLWRTDNNQRSWAIRLTTAGLLQFIGSTDGTFNAGTGTLLSYDISGLGPMVGAYIGVKRVSGVFTLNLNGSTVNTNTPASYNFHAGTGTLNIGGLQGGAAVWSTTASWDGNIHGVRLTKGANRTLAVPTEAFPIS